MTDATTRTPRRVLAPVFPFQDHTRTAERLIDIARRGPVEIHLLSVQPPYPGHVAMYFSPGALRRYHREDGLEELAPLRALLERARLPFVCVVEVGSRSAAIAHYAREQRCDEVLLPEEPGGLLGRLTLGLVGREVRALAATPLPRSEPG
jgi:nucleotide-binding universal stress UspA family protein